MDFKKLLKTWLLLALGVIIAAHTVIGIDYGSFSALAVAVLLLSLCNMVLKPLLMLFSLPFIILTFGLGIWLINALLFFLVGKLVDGFDVPLFWDALWGALVVSLTGAAANLLFGGSRVQIRTSVRTSRGGEPAGHNTSQSRKPLKGDDDDVIDI
jgi:putative membrane protein